MRDILSGRGIFILFVLGNFLFSMGCSEEVYVGPSGQTVLPASPSHNQYQEDFEQEDEIRDGFNFSPDELTLHATINLYRDENGIDPLALSEEMSGICREHSQNMADGAVAFGHGGFDERFDVLTESFLLQEVAENVAMAYHVGHPISEIMDDWLNSDGHRENIEGDYDYTGIGIAKSSDGFVFFTQMFLR